MSNSVVRVVVFNINLYNEASVGCEVCATQALGGAPAETASVNHVHLAVDSMLFGGPIATFAELAAEIVASERVTMVDRYAAFRLIVGESDRWGLPDPDELVWAATDPVRFAFFVFCGMATLNAACRKLNEGGGPTPG